MKTLLSLAAVAALAALSGCASGPAVRVASDSSANFASYSSFGFVKPLGTDQRGYQTMLSNYLTAAMRRELEARGLRYDETSPQLLVNFSASLTDKLRVSSVPSTPVYTGGYYGYRAGYYRAWPTYQDQVTQYKEGVLNIDIADAARKQLVWESVVSHPISSKQLDNLQAAVDTAVASAMAKFPRAAPAKP